MYRMQTVSLSDARTHLSRLIDQIASGAESEIVISRNGKPVARIVPIETDASGRIGLAKGGARQPVCPLREDLVCVPWRRSADCEHLSDEAIRYILVEQVGH